MSTRPESLLETEARIFGPHEAAGGELLIDGKKVAHPRLVALAMDAINGGTSRICGDADLILRTYAIRFPKSVHAARIAAQAKVSTLRAVAEGERQAGGVR